MTTEADKKEAATLKGVPPVSVAPPPAAPTTTTRSKSLPRTMQKGEPGRGDGEVSSSGIRGGQRKSLNNEAGGGPKPCTTPPSQDNVSSVKSLPSILKRRGLDDQNRLDYIPVRCIPQEVSESMNNH